MSSRAAVVALVFFFACSSSTVVKTSPLSVCDSCTAAQCTKPAADCAANKDCAAIDACVNAVSPCVGANADDPLCDDDCIKVACSLKHPDGTALYGAWQSCQSAAQCGACEKPCEPLTTPMQKCIVGQACDLAAPNPDDCKCSPPDGGVDGANDSSTSSPGGGCLQPTCAVVTAGDVNAALGAAITGPVTKNISDGTVQMTQCHYDPDAGAVNEANSVQIIYWTPYTRADFDAGRSLTESTAMAATTTVPNVGDAAFTAVPDNGVSGVRSLVVLSGCVQFQIVGIASVDQLVGLAKTILARL